MRSANKLPQRGAVLIVSLVILLAISMLAATVYETNLMQLQMAGNVQFRAQGLQQALAVVDAVLAEPGNIVPRGDVGHRHCAPHDDAQDCDEYSIVIDEALLRAVGRLQYYVVRQGPLLTSLPIMAQDRASSGRHYKAALLEIHASYQGVDQAQGRATVLQGVLVRSTHVQR